MEAELLTPEQEAPVEATLAEDIRELGSRSNRHPDVGSIRPSATCVSPAHLSLAEQFQASRFSVGLITAPLSFWSSCARSAIRAAACICMSRATF